MTGCKDAGGKQVTYSASSSIGVVKRIRKRGGAKRSAGAWGRRNLEKQRATAENLRDEMLRGSSTNGRKTTGGNDKGETERRGLS